VARGEGRPEARPEGRSEGRGEGRGDARGDRRPRRVGPAHPQTGAEGIHAEIPAFVGASAGLAGAASADRDAGERATGEAGLAEAQRPGRGRVFVSAGEQDGADEGKMRDFAAALAPGLELLAVEVRRNHTFLEVKPEALDGAVAALNGKDGFGKALLAEKARRRRR
jgi:ATP-dependent RNA helicase DeaD